jgi:branched-chain amino acid transport system substrate-binding protein
VAAELACEDIGGAVLGRPLQVMQADDQNKADIATGLAREWLDYRGVDVLVDGAGSSAGLAIQEVARQRKHIYVMCTPSATALIGKQCSPYGFQFAASTYALAKGVGSEVVKTGGDSWFFITADYKFGYSLERDTTEFVKQNEGKVLGNVRAPLGTTDFSQHILRAQTSGAKVIGLATGGGWTRRTSLSRRPSSA